MKIRNNNYVEPTRISTIDSLRTTALVPTCLDSLAFIKEVALRPLSISQLYD